MRHMLMVKKPTKPADKTPPSAPTNLAWSSPDTSTIIMTWTPGADAESGVSHEVRVNSGAPFPSSSPTGTTITGLPSRNTDYLVEVRARSQGGLSAWVSVTARTAEYSTPQGFPTPPDKTTALMRPQTGIVRTRWVAKDGTGDYVSVEAALKASFAENNARTETSRSVIIIKPGTYIENLVEVHEQTFLIGATGNPADVVIENTTDPAKVTGRGAIDTWGSTYCEGLTFRRVDLATTAGPGKDLPKYALHGSAGLINVWVNCVFDVGTKTLSNLAQGYPSIIGQDGKDGALTVMHKCKLIGGYLQADTNMHAAIGSASPVTEVFVYSQCEWSTTGNTGTGAAAGMFGFKPMDDARHDELWVVGCTVPFVDMPVAAGSILHNPGGLPKSSRTTVGTTDTRSDWPQPFDFKR